MGAGPLHFKPRHYQKFADLDGFARYAHALALAPVTEKKKWEPSCLLRTNAARIAVHEKLRLAMNPSADTFPRRFTEMAI
jgi:hypothetical protein